MSPNARRLSLITVFTAALLSGLVTAYVWRAHQPVQEQTTTTTTAPSAETAIGAPFKLYDQNGDEITNENFRGRLMLITFGYTSCPDICPMQLGLMRAAVDKLEYKKAIRVAPIMIMLDPEHDRGDHLRDYMGAYNHKSPILTALTGPPADIDALAKSYKIFYEKVTEPDAPDVYRIDHSVTIFLMDSKGQFVQSFTSPTADELAAGITDALNRNL